MPKRLIEVGNNGDTPKLVLGAKVPPHKRKYTSLSHCWGARLPLRTLKSNVETFEKQIPPELIPRTFRDAIAITKGLNIPFLWIDALCIVQDSLEEWEQEALKMQNTYSGSSLNIAASDSSWSEDSPSNDCTVVSTFNVQNEYGMNLLVRLQSGDTRDMTRRTRLSSRGWVLQEQILSHRMVSCMVAELHWECVDVYQSDTGAQFRQPGTYVRGIPRSKDNICISQQDDIWRKWMEDFSKRDFSFWKDRVPALSGVMQLYQSFTGDVPLLGLWRGTLLKDLLWVRLGNIPTNLDTYQVTNMPSWSWLSCPTEIAFDIWQVTMTTSKKDRYVVEEHHCRLTDYAVEWTASAFVSAIESAYIALGGPTRVLLLDTDESAEESNPPYFQMTSIGQRTSCAGQFDAGPLRSGQYTCMLLLSRSHSQTKAQRQVFIILEAVSSCSDYRRVGIGCALDNIFNDEWTQERLVVR